MNRNLDVSLVMERSWSEFKKHWTGLVGILLIVLVVSAGIAYINPYEVPANVTGEEYVNWFFENGLAYYGWSIMASVVQVALLAWFYKEALQCIKDKEMVFNADVVLRYLAVSILVGLATYVALFCCIIPVFFIAPRLIIAPLYIIDNPGMGVGEAIDRSWKDTKGNVIPLLALGLIAVLISVLGVICCFVGIVPASVLIYIILVVAYLILSGQSDDASEDKTTVTEESFVIEEKTVCR